MYKFTFVLFVFFISQMPTVSSADNAAEYKVKAAYIYNFARFTSWPDDGGKNIKVCVYGKDPFEKYIDGLDGKTVGDRTIKVVRTRNIETVKTCHIAFLNIIPPEQRLFERALKKIDGASVLTIADAKNVVNFGVMIGLVIEQDKIGFSVNYTVAKASDIEISSKLLKLAKEVM